MTRATLLAAALTLVVAGCSRHAAPAMPIVVGPYDSTEADAVFDAVAASVETSGYELTRSDRESGHIEALARTRHRRYDPSVVTVQVYREGWVAVDATPYEHPGLARSLGNEVEELALAIDAPGQVPRPEGPATGAPAAVPTLAWPSSPSAPGPSVGPTRVHREDVGMMVVGGVVFGLGYAGAVAWGASVLADIPLGNLSCNDLYGGLHLLPILGPLSGVGGAAGCVSLKFEEVLLPAVLTAAQLAGAIVFLVGLAGGDDVDYEGPDIGLSIDPSGGVASIGGRF